MWMNALRTMEDAVNLPLVPTYLTVSSVPVILDTPVMDLSAQVRQTSLVSWILVLPDCIHIHPERFYLLIFTRLRYVRNVAKRSI